MEGCEWGNPAQRPEESSQKANGSKFP